VEGQRGLSRGGPKRGGEKGVSETDQKKKRGRGGITRQIKHRGLGTTGDVFSEKVKITDCRENWGGGSEGQIRKKGGIE